MGKMDEIILVAPRQDVFQDETLTFQGVNHDSKQIATIMKQIENSFLEMRRGNAEDDPDYKQPIPYIVIKREHEVFLYERLSGGGESRLHNKLSIGFGGHMNFIEEKAFNDILSINTARELNEELSFQEHETKGMETIGLINDDENEVGHVHIGILSTLEMAPSAVVEVKEHEQIAGRWVTIADLLEPALYDRLETWSQFVATILADSEVQ